MICEDTTKLLIRAAALEGDAAITAWELATRELPAKVLAEHHLAPSIYHNLVGIGLLHHQLPELIEVYTRTWPLNQRMTKQAKGEHLFVRIPEPASHMCIEHHRHSRTFLNQRFINQLWFVLIQEISDKRGR